MRESQMSDSGVGHVCLALRETDQLEELYFSATGHSGLEFVLGVVRRCDQLQKLHVQVRDVPTLQENRRNVSEEDYDCSGYTAARGEDEEEEGQDDDENKPK